MCLDGFFLPHYEYLTIEEKVIPFCRDGIPP